MPLLRIKLSLLLRIPQQRLSMLFIGPDNPSKLPLPVGISTYLMRGFWAHPSVRSQPPNGISIGSAVSAGTSV